MICDSKCWKRLIFSAICLDFLKLYEVKDNTINDKITFYLI